MNEKSTQSEIETLKKEIDKLKSVLDHTPQPLYWKDENGVIEGCNQLFLSLLRMENKEDIVGKTADSLPWEDLEKRYEKDFSERVFKTQQPEFNVIDPHETDNNVRKWFKRSKVPYQTGTVESIEDVTNNQYTQMELIKAKESAEHANTFKSVFLTNMNHQLRTPLNGILGNLELLDDHYLHEEQYDIVKESLNSAKELLEIIDDISEFSVLDEEEATPKAKEFSLKELLETIGQNTRHKLQDKHLNFKLSFPESLPTNIISDSLLLKQILNKLLDNSIKFTQKGQIHLIVSEETHLSKPTLKFSIEDTGEGIPKENSKQIFQAFSQTDDTLSRIHGNTILGLSISKKLVNRLGGQIGYERQTHGSVFWFTIPLVSSISSNNEFRQEEEHADYSAFHVLIVEDNKINQKVAKNLINKIGCTSDVASNGLDAINLIKKNRYDLIFMDCQMPIMDGLTASKKIREFEDPLNRNIIIALTAHALKKDQEECFEAGMNDHITKPINVKMLRKVLDDWLI